MPVFLNTEGVAKGDPYSLFIVPAGGQFLVLFDDTSKPVGIYSNMQAGVFTAVLVAYDAESKTIVKSTHAVTIGKPVPPDPIPPGPDPTPPGPTPDVPADQFDNVGQLAQKLASGLASAARGQAKATAAIYRQAADKLSNGSFVNVTEAHKWISAERAKVWGPESAAWQPVIDEIGTVWNRFWPMDKGTVILFYRAVAGGWEAAR